MPNPQPARHQTIPDPPGEPGAVTVLARLLDGMAFRYRWAVDGLNPDELAYTPGQGAMTLGELLLHMRQLVAWVGTNVQAGRDGREPVVWSQACAGFDDAGLHDGGPEAGRPTGHHAEGAAEPAPLRLVEQTLATIETLRADLLALGDGGLGVIRLLGSSGPDTRPFWNAINGPLADFLTHVGQVNAWRRLMGRPAPRADVFRGLPPKASPG